MSPVVPALVAPFLAQATSPRYFTNTENVRRIAAGKNFVAFATSGGVRVFERARGSWHVYTQNEGLPTHNIHDLVFDKTNPDTLWVLCGSWGDWANDQPEPDLQLVTLDLKTGKVATIAPKTPAPRTARMGYPYFLDYRLSVSEDWAFVFTDKGAALAWDRSGKSWTRQVTVEATPPRASNYPGHTASLSLTAVSDTHLALMVYTSGSYTIQSQVQTLPDGRQSIVNKIAPNGTKPLPHVLLYERQTGRTTRHPLPDELLGIMTVVPGQAGGPQTIVYGGRPQALIPEGRSGSFLIEALGYEITQPDGNRTRTVTHGLKRYRVAPNLAQPTVISREKLTEQQVQQYQRTLNSIPLTYATDFLIDGNTLWITGYRQGAGDRSNGIVKVDLATNKPASQRLPGGLLANFATVELSQGKARVGWDSRWSFDGDRPQVSYLELLFDSQKDTLVESIAKSGEGLYPTSYTTYLDPRLTLKNDEEKASAVWLFQLAKQGDTALVLGPAQPGFRFIKDEKGQFQTTGLRSDHYFFLDIKTRKLTPLELGGLTDLQPKAAGFTEGGLFFLAEQKAPGERRGAPVVVRWDSQTGAVKRYPETLFRDVSIAAQRTAGVRQQADLKKRQTQRNERLKLDPQHREPAVEVRPVMEFLRPLSGSFLKAAGTTWLTLDQHLFRYDPERDTWANEGLADRLSPEGETALWKQFGPEAWRFESPEARRLRGTVARWSAPTGWQTLELGESARQASESVLYHEDALWLTGVGVLRLPRAAWRFQGR